MTVAPPMQQRRGTAAVWTANNPVLRDGQLAVEKDTGQLKIGDGITAWIDLAYYLPYSVLLAGAKGDVLTVTDASITSGTNQLNSNSADFTAADVGKRVLVVGAGAAFNNRGAWAAATSYAFGDRVTYAGNTYIWSGNTTTSGAAFDSHYWVKHPANSYTLEASIVSVTAGHAILSANAATTVSGAKCTYGTDDSAAINAALGGFAAATSGAAAAAVAYRGTTIYFPGNRTYFVQDLWVGSNTTIAFGPNVTLKLPFIGSADAASLRLMTSYRLATASISNVRMVGIPTFDFSEITPGTSATITPGMHIKNCTRYNIDGVNAVNMIGAVSTANAIGMTPNQGGTYPTRGHIDWVHNVGCRGTGGSAVELDAGEHLSFGPITSDGGIALRCEANFTAPINDVVCQLAHNTGESLFANAAVSWAAHSSSVAGVTVVRAVAERGADLLAISQTEPDGQVSNCTILSHLVTGGGAAVRNSGNDHTYPGVSIHNGSCDGSSLTTTKGGELLGVAYAMAPGMSFHTCRGLNSEFRAFYDIFQTAGVAAGTIRLYDCEGDYSAGIGVEVRATKNLYIFGGEFGDNPDFLTPIDDQLLGSTQTDGTLAGWAAGSPGSSGVSGASGVLTITADGTRPYALARTALGTGGVAVTPGHFYKTYADIAAGTGPANGGAVAALWFWKSDGTACASGAVATGTVSYIPTGGTVRAAVSAVAPADAAFVTMVVYGYNDAAHIGTNLTNGVTFTATTFTLQEVVGIAVQNYGIGAGAGCTVTTYGVELDTNGLGATVGAGTVNQH